MSANTQQNSLDFMEAAGHALTAAEKFASDVNGEKQAARTLAESLIPVMLENRLVEATDVPMLQAKLASHDGVVEVLGHVVNHHQKTKVAYAQKVAVAQAGGTQLEGHDKAASAAEAGTRTSPYVGGRAGLGEHRPSDDPLLKLAGLATR